MIHTSLLNAWRDHLFWGRAVPTLFKILRTPQFFFAKFQEKYVWNIHVYTVTNKQTHAHTSASSNKYKSVPIYIQIFYLFITRKRYNEFPRSQLVSHLGLSSVSIWTLLTVLNYWISNDPLYVRFEINLLLWIYSPLY